MKLPEYPTPPPMPESDNAAVGGRTAANCSPFWEGKRILIAWTDKAYREGSDWPSFVVESETDDGLFLRGCDAPDGTKHDGTHCFAKHSEIRDLWEWVSEANAKAHTPRRER